MNVVIFGPPGSGKGTQSLNISKLYDISIIDTGKILRSSDFYDSISSSMNKGILLSDDIIINIMENAIKKIKGGFILDGFPRTTKQAKFLFVEQANRIVIDYIFVLKVDKKNILERLKKRKICASCGIVVSKDTCSMCNSNNFSKRSDDNENVIINRINQYNDSYTKILPFFDKEKVVEIEGSKNESIVFQEICSYLYNES